MSISFTQARDALVSYISAQLTSAFPDLEVVWDNAEQVDLTTIGDQFLQVDVDFEDRYGADLEGVTDHVAGTVGFRYFVKAGRGSRSTLVVFDTLDGLFRQRNISGVQTLVPRPGSKDTRNGWRSADLHLPLEYYS